MLLKDCWTLLDIFHDEDGRPLFVLGSQAGMREFLEGIGEDAGGRM